MGQGNAKATFTKLDFNVKQNVKFCFHCIFLVTVFLEKSSSHPIRSSTTASIMPNMASTTPKTFPQGENGEKVKSRIARHTSSNSPLGGREVYLHNMYSYNLAVSEAGEVYGARDYTTDCSILREPRDGGLVFLKAMSSERYLTINDKGELKTTATKSSHNLLEERLVHYKDGSYYYVYSSYIYRRKNWFVGIDRNGVPIRHMFATRHHHNHRKAELFTLGAHPTPIVITAEADAFVK